MAVVAADLRPMIEFNPWRRSLVHDRLNDRMIEWQPAWLASFIQDSADHEPGVIEWDGLLLDGWCDLQAV